MTFVEMKEYIYLKINKGDIEDLPFYAHKTNKKNNTPLALDTSAAYQKLI